MRNSVFMEPSADRRTDWETPPKLFAQLDEEFRFNLDVCANETNAKCDHYFSPEVNGLAQKWSGMCWMNPPYGAEISAWIQKAYESACSGDATVVCLLPARSNNEWWKLVIQSECRFIRKKLRFVGAPSVSMFPNVIAIFHAHLDPGGVMKIFRL